MATLSLQFRSETYWALEIDVGYRMSKTTGTRPSIPSFSSVGTSNSDSDALIVHLPRILLRKSPGVSEKMTWTWNRSL